MKRACCGEFRVPEVGCGGDVELSIEWGKPLAYSVKMDRYSSCVKISCQPLQIFRCSSTKEVDIRTLDEA
jgi:hypothetical protein